MVDKFQFKDLAKRVEKLEKGIKFSREKGRGIVEYKGEKSKPIPITTSGIMDEDDVYTLAGELSKFGLGKREDIYANLTKPSYQDYRMLFNILLAVFTAGFFFFGILKTNLTGAVIGVSNLTSNIGIIICVVGIIGLLVWRKLF